jgi:transcriptional regulator with PAS, ATPase and Fis domain
VERVGGSQKIPVDVRIIAASNRDLETMMHEGNFRKDLYFRLSVIPLHIPPLKERSEDIPALVQCSLDKYAPMLNKSFKSIEPLAMDCMLQYDWPGNVRELENAVEYAVNMAPGDIITLSSLPPRIRDSQQGKTSKVELTLKDRVRDYEKTILQEYLELYGNSYDGKSIIAEKLEISRATLYRKLAELGLSG